MSKLYPIGIQNFESLRNDGYFYVDKTALLYRLVKTGRYFFLSRPRRFGKSLMISTLQAYFEGKKELFEGLAIEQLEKDWVKRPVLHLDLNIEKYNTPESLDKILNDTLVQWEELYGTRPSETSFSLRFAGIIRRACEKSGERVAILVDEYDKPMLQAIGDVELQKAFRTTLKPFYGVLKSMDGYIKFALLTGVTKFGKVSVFSDLNNLNDISMDDLYVELCGITEKEIHTNFEDELHELADAQKMSYEDVCRELKACYDGYHFVENSIGIYNPFSLLNTFLKMKFGSYWFETGTPSYLVELLKRHNYDLYRMAHEETNADILNSIDSESTNPIPVIYQSGYLTIKGYDPRFGMYRLGFPNREVEEGFLKYLMPFYANADKVDSPFQIQKFVNEVETGQVDAFFRRLSSLMADTPYELVRDLELHYQNILFIVFKLVGFYVKAEYHTSEGRVDLVLQTDKYTYVMEFKFDSTAEEALRQINEKHYARPFEADTTRTLYKIGVNFSSKTRNIEKWLVETVDPAVNGNRDRGKGDGESKEIR
ncbi:AAA family ATPase [Parabacteroides sp. AF17-3]|uniref:ATP-binding protein n=1 Tax=Parabacteroides sp. AF17-3 TaxID=2293113 RepID=UPI000EFE6293|nr:ATP-binding protein [Parabacteroides sp. AF17-3]RKU70691.1 AAA family ATPase [Parabacteroides sp. AF17-3]